MTATSPYILAARLAFVTVVCFLSAEFLTLSSSAESSPVNSAKTTLAESLEKFLVITEHLPGDGNRDERRKQLRNLTSERFDFSEMSRRVLGANWDQMTEDQRQEFTALFSDLLARTYIGRVEKVKRGQVTIVQEKNDPAGTTVNTIVKVEQGTFPIDYRLRLKEGKWRVYDVRIESIGVISNYRSEFGGIVEKEGIESLLARLRAKKSA